MKIPIYRGKSIETNEWVYGTLPVPDELENTPYRKPNDTLKCNNQYVSVNPETVGLCSDIKDSDGILIYEGDIFQLTVRTIFNSNIFSWHKEFITTYLANIENGVCKGRYNAGNFPITQILKNATWGESDECQTYYHTLRVIGNIHDDPSLIEGYKAMGSTRYL